MFFRGVETTNQVVICNDVCSFALSIEWLGGSGPELGGKNSQGFAGFGHGEPIRGSAAARFWGVGSD